MFYLYDHETAKRYHAERVRRSAAKAKENSPIDQYVSPVKKHEADIVEIQFGAWCDSQPLGA